nr:unnamed protein product [Digitaria exilis]
MTGADGRLCPSWEAAVRALLPRAHSVALCALAFFFSRLRLPRSSTSAPGPPPHQGFSSKRQRWAGRHRACALGSTGAARSARHGACRGGKRSGGCVLLRPTGTARAGLWTVHETSGEPYER